MAEVFIVKTQIQDNTLIITVIPHGATKHLMFLPLDTELSIFVIKIHKNKRSNKFKGLNVNIKNTNNNDLETIWIKIPYLGDKGDQLFKSLKTKLKHHFTK